MNDTKENNPNSPLNAAKTLNSEGEGNHTTKLEKAITQAFMHYLDNISVDSMALIDAHQWLLSSMRGQVDVFQTLATEITPSSEQIQIRAGSLVGFTEGLLNQIDALSAIIEALTDQVHDLTKEKKQAEASLQRQKLGGASWVV